MHIHLLPPNKFFLLVMLIEVRKRKKETLQKASVQSS